MNNGFFGHGFRRLIIRDIRGLKQDRAAHCVGRQVDYRNRRTYIRRRLSLKDDLSAALLIFAGFA